MIVKTAKRLDSKSVAEVLALKNSIPGREADTYNVESKQQDSRDAAVRQTEVRWLMQKDYPDLHRKLAELVIPHAQELKLPTGVVMEPGLQLATYYPGHHFSWHHDGSARDASKRILSMSVLLSDDFDGGRLEFRSPGAPKLKKAGDVIIFHSVEVHRVTPVIRGVRDALVTWFKVT